MKILAVEDDPLSLYLLENTLRSLGCDVETSTDGEDAWARLQTSSIRVVVGDWRMPGMDGLDLCRRIRAHGGDYVYYILLTEMEANEANENAAAEAGVDDFLSKPIVPHELRNRLRVARRILGYTRQVRQLESFLPVCGVCQRVRNDDNYWQQIDRYLSDRAGTAFSRGICPDCYERSVMVPLQELDGAPPEKSPVVPTAEKSGAARPTLAMIARQLGVTVATVSMALRNNPRISAEMRARARAAADALGYQPDPTLGKMLHRLRTRRPTSFKSVLCALTTIPEAKEPPYVSALIRGAQLQAVKRGYGITVMRLRDPAAETAKLQQTLVSRGVEGVLLLPMAARMTCADWIDWREFSVVAATLSVTAPDCDRVVSHWLGSTKQAYRELAALGCRRIGAVVSREHDAMLNHKLTAGIAWHNQFGDAEAVAPFFLEGAPLDFAASLVPAPGSAPHRALQAWFARERPDALLVDDEKHVQPLIELLAIEHPGSVAIAVLDRSADLPHAGVIERPFDVGIAAVDLLDRKIQADEKGLPDVPTITHVKGRWMPGARAGERR